MTHTFDLHWYTTLNGKFLCYGDESRAIRLHRSTNGYLWVHKKQLGYTDNIQAAIDWIEAAAEIYPRKLH